MAYKKEQQKLLIDPIFKKEKKFFKKSSHVIVQNEPLKHGLWIKNIGKRASSEGTIKDFLLKSTNGGTLKQDVEEQLDFPSLNPGESREVWWPDPITPFIKGEVWMGCSILPKEFDRIEFVTFQYEHGCKKESLYKEINSWGNAILVRGELEQEQSKTNRLILILTLLTFLEGVWGLDKIFQKSFILLGGFFNKIGGIFSWLGC